MIEDKLTHDERIRLEALAQAVLLKTFNEHETVAQTIGRAKTLETYIRDLS